MTISGIYIIYNLTTEQYYIGSTENFGKRFTSHRSELCRNKHGNYKLQEAFNRGDKLVYCIMEFCEPEKTLELENEYLMYYSPQINIAKDATAPMKGRNHSEKTKNKYKGRKVWNKGIPRTEEEKTLMSKNRKEVFDNMTSEERLAWKESRKNINHGRYWKNKTLPKESREKIRLAQLNKNSSIVCIETEKVYQCQKDAAQDLKIRQGHISEQLNGKRKTAGGYTFERINKKS